MMPENQPLHVNMAVHEHTSVLSVQLRIFVMQAK